MQKLRLLMLHVLIALVCAGLTGCEVYNVYSDDPAALAGELTDMPAETIENHEPPAAEPPPEPAPVAEAQPDPTPAPPTPPPPPPAPAPVPSGRTFAWDGYSRIYVNPALNWRRVWWVTHTGPDGKKYDWRSGDYHVVMEPIVYNIPADGWITVTNPGAIAREGIVQVNGETHEMASASPRIAIIWLIRPGVPAESYLTLDDWRAGKSDGVLLQIGRDG